MKYARSQIRLLIAEVLLRLALWVVPKDSPEAAVMARCLNDYAESVIG